MKKLLLSCVVLFLLNILHFNQLQAQDWQNQKSVTLHTQFPTDTYAQKVKVYNNDYLVGITKKDGVDHYGFVLWKNNDNYQKIFMLNTPDIIINDFTFYENILLFSGKQKTPLDEYMAIVGRLNVNDLINGVNPSYEYRNVGTADNLTKILVNVCSGHMLVSAIGEGSNSIPSSYSQLIHFNLGDSGPIFYNPFAFNQSIPIEIIWDMFYDDNYLITLGVINSTSSYVVRYFKYNGLFLENESCFVYTFPGISFVFDSNPESYPLHISDISQNKFAVSVSASNGQKDFAMINIHEKGTDSICSSQLLYSHDKDNKLLEMEYAPEIKRLLLLNDTYFTGVGKIQTITYVNPFDTNTYVTLMESFNTPSKINHFSMISNKHYAVAGTYSFSQSNNLQLFATKYIFEPYLNCLDNSLVKIYQNNSIHSNNYFTIPAPIMVQIPWTTDNFLVLTENITIDCIDNN